MDYQVLDDNDATVIYGGLWKLITGSAQHNMTQHVTFYSNATVYAPFKGKHHARFITHHFFHAEASKGRA